jgi:hypothetical protein
MRTTDHPSRSRSDSKTSAVDDPGCPEEIATRRLHARAIAMTATLIAAGATLVGAGAAAYLLQPLGWPQTEGIVEHSAWVVGTTEESQGAAIGYRYVVDDIEYQSDRLSLFASGGRTRAGSGQWPWDERALVEEHGVGAPIVVRYDPADPARSVIVATWNMPGLWIAAGVLALAWGIAAECWRRSRGPLTDADLETMGWRWGNPD